MYGKTTIYFNDGWSLYPCSFEKTYEIACSIAEPSEEIERITIGNSIPAFRVRSIDRNEVTNRISFLSYPYNFNFTVTCDLSEEKQLLKDLQVVLESIEL